MKPAGVLALIFLLSGCVGTTGESQASTPPPVGSSSPSASPLLPTSSASAPPQTDAPESPETFDKAALIDLCLEVTGPDFGSPFSPDRARAVIERNESEYPWFVLVPGVAEGSESLAYCTIGGTPSEPTFLLRGAAAAELEDEIRSWVQ